MHNKILKNPPYLIILEGTNQGKKCVFGVFISQKINSTKTENSYEEIYHIPKSDDCLLFYYEEEFCMHFNLPNTN